MGLGLAIVLVLSDSPVALQAARLYAGFDPWAGAAFWPLGWLPLALQARFDSLGWIRRDSGSTIGDFGGLGTRGGSPRQVAVDWSTPETPVIEAGRVDHEKSRKLRPLERAR